MGRPTYPIPRPTTHPTTSQPPPVPSSTARITHIATVSVVKRKTARKRQSRALKRVAEWCKRNRHAPVDQQQRYLSAVLLGHYAYFGVTRINRALGAFWNQVRSIWHVWLRRRSQRRRLTWEGFARLLKRYPLPPPKIVHSTYRPQANPCS